MFKLSPLVGEPLGRTSGEIGSISLNSGDLIGKQKGYYQADHPNHLDDHLRASAARLIEFD